MTLVDELPLCSELMSLSDREYRLLRDLVYNKFGINLGEQKRALIVGRLQKVLRENHFSNFADYYDYVVAEQTGHALEILINRISTNHTFFYREKEHFEFFVEKVLPWQAKQQQTIGSKSLRVWCPGCSSGEEPYTLAMLISEFFGRTLPTWDVGILATDISTRVLEKAREGVYPMDSIRKLPMTLSQKYFQTLNDQTGALDDKIKKMVLFRRLNLMRERYPFKGRFHAIFCRNVMIYFDQPTRIELVMRLHRYLEPDGFLFIGHSESLGRGNQYFRYVQPAVYRRVDGA